MELPNKRLLLSICSQAQERGVIEVYPLGVKSMSTVMELIGYSVTTVIGYNDLQRCH